MKFLVIFALALATASAFDLRSGEIQQRSIEVPVAEDIEGRITNGQNAAIGQFPYQVGLSLKLGFLSSSWCGGSLIGKQWVLTAAHCTDGAKSVTVYLGATVRTQAELTVTVDKSNILIHAGWNSKTLKNDISLIKIPSIAYTAKIQPIKLPAIAKSYSSYVGDKAVASGWGHIADKTNVVNDLQWAPMEIVADSVCVKFFRSFFTSSNICVSTPNAVSTCQGDSGGPLVLSSDKVQVGLTSYGGNSCVKGYPVVFTRLTSYLDWIEANTGIAY